METTQSRLFVGVPLADEVRSRLEKGCRELRKRVEFSKWVHPKDYHITLQFLGATDNAAAEKLITILSERIGQAAPFELYVAGVGSFGSPSSPRILWAGVAGDLAALEQLQKRVTESTRPLGFPTEDRPYRPHITIAKKYKGKAKFPQEMDLSEAGEGLFLSRPWMVREAVLFRTHMRRTPMYEEAARFPLAGR